MVLPIDASPVVCLEVVVRVVILRHTTSILHGPSYIRSVFIRTVML